METERKLSHDNAKGCLMGFQHVKNFSINKLGSKKDIYNTKETRPSENSKRGIYLLEK